MFTRKVVVSLMGVLLASSLAFAQKKEETKDASGTVKSVAAKTLTITHDGKDMSFVIDAETTVTAKGASHKMREAEGAGKSTQITDFVMDKQTVNIKYTEKDGKMYAKEVRVR